MMVKPGGVMRTVLRHLLRKADSDFLIEYRSETRCKSKDSMWHVDRPELPGGGG